jgi:hypothetical protein
LHVTLFQTKQQTNNNKKRSDPDTKPTEKPKKNDLDWWKKDGGDVGSMSYPDKKSTKNKKRRKKQKSNMRPHKIAGVEEGGDSAQNLGVYAGTNYNSHLFGGVRI